MNEYTDIEINKNIKMPYRERRLNKDKATFLERPNLNLLIHSSSLKGLYANLQNWILTLKGMEQASELI